MKINKMIGFIILILISLVHVFLLFEYGPTWDFPMHYLSGQVKMGEVVPPVGYHPIMYGVFTDIVPIFFSRIFPTSWFPWSFLLFGVVVGCAGVMAFYAWLREEWSEKIALLSAMTVFLLPRWVGHLHTNTKDVVMVSFLLICGFYFARYMKHRSLWDGLFTIVFFVCSLNTKITALQFIPILFAWVVFQNFFHERKHFWRQMLRDGGVVAMQVVGGLFFWFLLWPTRISEFFDEARRLSGFFPQFFDFGVWYAPYQFVSTTPLLILLFSFVGVYALSLRVVREKHTLSFVFVFFYLFTIFKYPILRLPAIDDIRYFLEIVFPLSLCFVIGVEYSFRRFSWYAYVGIFIFFLFIQYQYHPYQIAYTNILAKNPDVDFWAASYQEAISYINDVAKPEDVVSIRLAPELAGMLIRPDLREKLNSKSPEESDMVLILNRPSFFKIFQVEQFLASHQPQKVITPRNGVPMSWIYF